MPQSLLDAYLFFKTLPDRLYPFSMEVEGQLVRGRLAYTRAVDEAWEKYGPHHMGYKLAMYREFFHFLGSIIFIIAATWFSDRFFDSERALYVLMGAAIVALFAQEFYFHPKYYLQPRGKGIADWLTWVIPMMIYLFLFNN
jgi:hypothetical protein